MGIDQRKTCFKILKMALPHIGLSLFLVAFLLAGAWAFRQLEHHQDRDYLDRKLFRIREAYEKLVDFYASEVCPQSATRTSLKKSFYKSLSKLSSFLEDRPFDLNSEMNNQNDNLLMPHRWNCISSTLYALSILTTTGYTYVFPMTAMGQIFAIVYGLIGIPLMVLLAVDIGRYLSDSVLFLYIKSSSLLALFGFCQSKLSVEVITTTITPNTVLRKESFKSVSSLDGKTRRLPLWVIGSIFIVFCLLGSIVYIICNRSQKPFIEAFFITFNLVANLTMSEMPSEVSTILTLMYTIFFVTFGLSVLSMCADLAASELKWLFMKIHYYGRKISWKRGIFLSQMDEDVDDLLLMIEDIRLKKPDKEKITSSDILNYIHEIRGPENRLMTQRRDTIAFMPQSIEALRFADEIDMDELSYHRSISQITNPENRSQFTTN